MVGRRVRLVALTLLLCSLGSMPVLGAATEDESDEEKTLETLASPEASQHQMPSGPHSAESESPDSREESSGLEGIDWAAEEGQLHVLESEASSTLERCNDVTLADTRKTGGCTLCKDNWTARGKDDCGKLSSDLRASNCKWKKVLCPSMTNPLGLHPCASNEDKEVEMCVAVPVIDDDFKYQREETCPMRGDKRYTKPDLPTKDLHVTMDKVMMSLEEQAKRGGDRAINQILFHWDVASYYESLHGSKTFKEHREKADRKEQEEESDFVGSPTFASLRGRDQTAEKFDDSRVGGHEERLLPTPLVPMDRFLRFVHEAAKESYAYKKSLRLVANFAEAVAERKRQEPESWVKNLRVMSLVQNLDTDKCICPEIGDECRCTRVREGDDLSRTIVISMNPSAVIEFHFRGIAVEWFFNTIMTTNILRAIKTKENLTDGRTDAECQRDMDLKLLRDFMFDNDDVKAKACDPRHCRLKGHGVCVPKYPLPTNDLDMFKPGVGFNWYNAKHFTTDMPLVLRPSFSDIGKYVKGNFYGMAFPEDELVKEGEQFSQKILELMIIFTRHIRFSDVNDAFNVIHKEVPGRDPILFVGPDRINKSNCWFAQLGQEALTDRQVHYTGHSQLAVALATKSSIRTVVCLDDFALSGEQMSNIVQQAVSGIQECKDKYLACAGKYTILVYNLYTTLEAVDTINESFFKAKVLFDSSPKDITLDIRRTELLFSAEDLLKHGLNDPAYPTFGSIQNYLFGKALTKAVTYDEDADVTDPVMMIRPGQVLMYSDWKIVDTVSAPISFTMGVLFTVNGLIDDDLPASLPFRDSLYRQQRFLPCVWPPYKSKALSEELYEMIGCHANHERYRDPDLYNVCNEVNACWMSDGQDEAEFDVGRQLCRQAAPECTIADDEDDDPTCKLRWSEALSSSKDELNPEETKPKQLEEMGPPP